MNEKDFEVQNIFGKGGANTAYAKYFTGNSFLNPVKIGGGDCPLMIANVTFEPGCRNNWHVHHASPAGRTKSCQHESRGRSFLSPGSKALARCKGGQLVQPPGL